MKCTQKDCCVDMGVGCSMGEPNLENCEHLPTEYKRRLVCRDKFLELYRKSIHYKALQEANENHSEVFFLSYCHDSDDFIDPSVSDAYGVFKACHQANVAIQNRLDTAYDKLALLRQTELWREDEIFELYEELEQALNGDIH